MNEQELVRLLKQQDRKAYEFLIREFQHKVVSTCLSYTHHREDAEDLAQDVFIQVFRSIDKFKSNSTVSTWICSICVRKCLDHIRSKNRQKRQGSVSGTIEVGELADYLKNPSLNPEQQMLQVEDLAFLFKAMEQLSEKKRTALILSKIEGLSRSEIAKILRCSESAVDTMVHRGRKELKEIMKKIMEG